jgi:hypothetical protein
MRAAHEELLRLTPAVVAEQEPAPKRRAPAKKAAPLKLVAKGKVKAARPSRTRKAA